MSPLRSARHGFDASHCGGNADVQKGVTILTTVSSRRLVLPLQNVFRLPSHIQIVVGAARTTGSDSTLHPGSGTACWALYAPVSSNASRRTRARPCTSKQHVDFGLHEDFDCLGDDADCMTRAEQAEINAKAYILQETPLRAKKTSVVRDLLFLLHRPAMHARWRRGFPPLRCAPGLDHVRVGDL